MSIWRTPAACTEISGCLEVARCDTGQCLEVATDVPDLRDGDVAIRESVRPGMVVVTSRANFAAFVAACAAGEYRDLCGPQLPPVREPGSNAGAGGEWQWGVRFVHGSRSVVPEWVEWLDGTRAYAEDYRRRWPEATGHLVRRLVTYGPVEAVGDEPAPDG